MTCANIGKPFCLAVALSIFVIPDDDIAQARTHDTIPLFEDIWSGKLESDVPEHMPNPTRLHRRFVNEARILPWADTSEQQIRSVVEEIGFAEMGPESLSHYQAECRTSICEIVMIIPGASLPEGEEDTHINTASFRMVDMLKLKLGKEYSLTLGMNDANNDRGVLIYMFAPGSEARG